MAKTGRFGGEVISAIFTPSPIYQKRQNCVFFNFLPCATHPTSVVHPKNCQGTQEVVRSLALENLWCHFLCGAGRSIRDKGSFLLRPPLEGHPGKRRTLSEDASGKSYSHYLLTLTTGLGLLNQAVRPTCTQQRSDSLCRV